MTSAPPGPPETPAELDELLAKAAGELQSDTDWYTEATRRHADLAAQHRARRADLIAASAAASEWKANAAADANPAIVELAADVATAAGEERAALEQVKTGRTVVEALCARATLAAARAAATRAAARSRARPGP